MKVLVTGGGGFLGGAIARRLNSLGYSVRSLSRGHYPELSALGVEQIRGDLADRDAVRKATAGCELVFHVAAKAGVWGSYESFYQANVVGTRNVIDACLTQGVPKLVYTSTPSVVHTGGDIEGANESLPYAQHFTTHYPKTKAEAEQLVLAANLPNLATVALRPHLIWGPGDNHLVPRIVEHGKQGRLRKIGSAEKLVDATYIDNAVDAHILAGQKLALGSPIAGKAYFIANDEPMPIWELVNGILRAGGLQPVERAVPYWLAYSAGAVMEFIGWFLRSENEMPMTRFVAQQLATAHWYDLSAAKRDLGYDPKITTEEGLRRLREHLLATSPSLAKA